MVHFFYPHTRLDSENRSADRTVPSVLQQGREMTSHHHESRASCCVLSGDRGVGHSGLLLKLAGVRVMFFWKACVDLGWLPGRSSSATEGTRCSGQSCSKGMCNGMDQPCRASFGLL